MRKNTHLFINTVLFVFILIVLTNEDKINLKKDTFQNQIQIKQTIQNNNKKQEKSLSMGQINIKSEDKKKQNSKIEIQAKDSSLMLGFKSQQNQKIKLYVKQVMENNRNKIIQHNSNKNNSYKMKENRFMIYTTQQFEAIFMNLHIPNESYIKNKHLKSNNTSITQEKSLIKSRGNRVLQEVTVDWKFLRKMTSVKYQKQCGSCYSFSAISVIQSAYVLFKNQYVNLAEQQIVDCSIPYGNLGCQGGWTTNVFQYVKDFGVVYEADYPYFGKTNQCKVNQSKKVFSIQNFIEIENDCNLVVQALRRQPLSIAINADGWQYYSSGIYTDCKLGPSNHGVVLAGVDSQSWLIKNSWGYSWGQQGYIRISRTALNNSCNVCQWASYPVL